MTSPTLTKMSVSSQLGNTHDLFISYNGDIQTSTVTVDRIQFLKSLNYLGSNLGLWPGLGLYQLLEGAVAFIFSLKLLDKIKRRI